MYRPKSSSQLVIYSSKVRAIKFTVPRLAERHDADCSAAKWKSEPNLEADVEERTRARDVISVSSDRLSSHCNKFISTDSLGNLNPELYVNVDQSGDDNACNYYSDDNIGRVWIGVEYNADTERLLVTLLQIKNLPSRDRGTANACDPFVRVSLMPSDERRFMQSKVKKKTCNPVFDESFIFQVAHKDLAEHALKLTVYDVIRQRHVVIGHAVYSLTNHLFDDRVIVWRDLERELVQVKSTPHDNVSELMLSLSYNDNIQRLIVGVLAGRNFSDTRGSSAGSSEFYVKVKLSISKSDIRKKRTGTFKHVHPRHKSPYHIAADDAPVTETVVMDPVFNESFAFQVSNELLNASNLIVTAKQAMSTGRRDKLVGRVVLGSFMFARGVELEHWTQMMSTPKQQISRWHKLSH